MRVIVLVLTLAGAAQANEKFFAAETVDCAQVKTVPAAPGDPAWRAIAPKRFTVSAQRAIRLNDKLANEQVEKPGVGSIAVKAAYSDTELGVYVEWHDAAKNTLRHDETNAYGDAVAMELPVKYGAGQRLPHVGMGDEKQYVYVYMQRATEDSNLTNEFLGGGFGSLTRRTPVGKMKMEYDEKAQLWRAVFVRPLVAQGHSLMQGLVPIAFAVWDGARYERGGNKQLSSWRFLKLSRYPIDPGYLQVVSWGYGEHDLGDPQKGKVLVSSVCIACHQFPELKVAPYGVAPDLSDVGAIATLTYLRDSIVDPNEVVVHHLHMNAHYNKGATPDQFGAYPNATSYSWYNPVDQRKTSKMPQFTNFTSEQVADMVAYLHTLDGTPK